MARFILIISIATILQNCTSNYYIYQAPQNTYIYENYFAEDGGVMQIPAGERVVAEKTNENFLYVKYKDAYGWVSTGALRYYKRANRKSYGDLKSFNASEFWKPYRVAKQNRHEDSLVSPHSDPEQIFFLA